MYKKFFKDVYFRKERKTSEKKFQLIAKYQQKNTNHFEKRARAWEAPISKDIL